VVLTFPAGIANGQYSFFASWATLAPQAVVGSTITVNWTAKAAEPLVQGQIRHLAYQWTVST
jgi:hypothetical protein